VEGDGGGFAVIPRPDQPREFCRAGDVGALADHLKVAVRTNREHFEAGELRELTREARRGRRFVVGLSTRGSSVTLKLLDLPRREPFHGFGDLANMVGRGAAAAADDVDKTTGGKFLQCSRRIVWLLVVFATCV